MKSASLALLPQLIRHDGVSLASSHADKIHHAVSIIKLLSMFLKVPGLFCNVDAMIEVPWVP
jgi:hypothetical protein